MAEAMTTDAVRQRVEVELSDADATALAAQYANQASSLAAFPQADLKAVEPPLHSIPGPPLGSASEPIP